MASIFFTERLPGISKLQSVERFDIARGAVWFDPCIPAKPENAHLPRPEMLIIAADCDNPERGFPTGFLKSRVYAKLLMRLISEHYQTFNRQIEQCEANGA